MIAVSDGSGDLIGGTPNRYDEYGMPQGTLTGRFGYTGQTWLPDAGLYHYRNRVYNPAMGRFMQTDPIGFGGGVNWYAYVRNNPVNSTDPLGLDGPDCRNDPDDDNCAEVTGPRRPRTAAYDWEFFDINMMRLGVGLEGQCTLPLGVTISWYGNFVNLTGH